MSTKILTSSRFALIAVHLLTGATTEVLLKALVELETAATEDKLVAANWVTIIEEAIADQMSVLRGKFVRWSITINWQSKRNKSLMSLQMCSE